MPRLRPLLAVLIAVVALVSPVAATAETRVALIIANSHYTAFDKLTNPSADASLIESALKKVGFTEIMVREDLGRDAMNRVLQEFGNKADKADVALIYYAGHGVEVATTNYLVPVDVVFAHERDVDIEAVRLDTALAVTENAKQMRIVIIDACRTDLVDKMGKSSAGVTSKGLQTVDPHKGLLVWLSAKGNTPAYDGRGNSPFAQSLARRITEPGREVSKLFNEVRDDVLQTTQNKQEPVPYGTSQDFFFVPPVAVAAAVAVPVLPPVPTIDIEKENYDICKSSLSTAPCEAYLASYPKGVYARLAHMKVTDITTTAAANQASVATTVAAIRAQLAASMQAPAAPVAVAANSPALTAPPVASHAGAASSPPVAVAANVVPASANAPGGGSVGASRSTNIGGEVSAPPPAVPGFAMVPAASSAPLAAAPAPAPVVQQVSAPTSAPAPKPVAVATASPLPAAAIAPPAAAPVPAVSTPAPAPHPAQVTAATPAPAPALTVATPAPATVAVVTSAAPPVAVTTPAPRPVQVAMLTPAPAPTATPIAAALTPTPTPVPTPVAVLAPPPHPAVALAPLVPTSVRMGALGITVRYDKVAKGIFVDAIDNDAPFVAGKLQLGDLITKIGTAAPNSIPPDPAQAPDAQLAANWKSDGRIWLLVKHGDAVRVVNIRNN